jgi:hypothetical protein
MSEMFDLSAEVLTGGMNARSVVAWEDGWVAVGAFDQDPNKDKEPYYPAFWIWTPTDL